MRTVLGSATRCMSASWRLTTSKNGPSCGYSPVTLIVTTTSGSRMPRSSVNFSRGRILPRATPVRSGTRHSTSVNHRSSSQRSSSANWNCRPASVMLAPLPPLLMTHASCARCAAGPTSGELLSRGTRSPRKRNGARGCQLGRWWRAAGAGDRRSNEPSACRLSCSCRWFAWRCGGSAEGSCRPSRRGRLLPALLGRGAQRQQHARHETGGATPRLWEEVRRNQQVLTGNSSGKSGKTAFACKTVAVR